jgi:hypothetical protein
LRTVGPVWRGGKNGEPELLANADRNRLKRAAENGWKTVAFPSVSAGIYGSPIDRAASVALRTILASSSAASASQKARIVLFGDAALRAYQTALPALQARAKLPNENDAFAKASALRFSRTGFSRLMRRFISITPRSGLLYASFFSLCRRFARSSSPCRYLRTGRERKASVRRANRVG